MDQNNRKTKFVSILSKLAEERKTKAQRALADHHFFIRSAQEKASLFDYLIFQAILEQADKMSLVFGKPHQFQVMGAEETRLSREVYATLDKAAILRPTRLGPLSLIG